MDEELELTLYDIERLVESVKERLQANSAQMNDDASDDILNELLDVKDILDRLDMDYLR